MKKNQQPVQDQNMTIDDGEELGDDDTHTFIAV